MMVKSSKFIFVTYFDLIETCLTCQLDFPCHGKILDFYDELYTFIKLWHFCNNNYDFWQTKTSRWEDWELISLERPSQATKLTRLWSVTTRSYLLRSLTTQKMVVISRPSIKILTCLCLSKWPQFSLQCLKSRIRSSWSRLLTFLQRSSKKQWYPC